MLLHQYFSQLPSQWPINTCCCLLLGFSNLRHISVLPEGYFTPISKCGYFKSIQHFWPWWHRLFCLPDYSTELNSWWIHLLRPSKTIATLAVCCQSAAHCSKYDERNAPWPITVFGTVVVKTSELMRPKSHHSSVVLKHCCYRIFAEKSKSKWWDSAIFRSNKNTFFFLFFVVDICSQIILNRGKIDGSEITK